MFEENLLFMAICYDFFLRSKHPLSTRSKERDFSALVAWKKGKLKTTKKGWDCLQFPFFQASKVEQSLALGPASAVRLAVNPLDDAQGSIGTERRGGRKAGEEMEGGENSPVKGQYERARSGRCLTPHPILKSKKLIKQYLQV